MPTETAPPIPVLVAEDYDDYAFLLQEYCRDSEFEITHVQNGEQAVQMYQMRAFKVVVMDMKMPIMDGAEAIRLIRQFEKEKRGRTTPIFALTDSAMVETRLKAGRAGCTRYLQKPISRDQFLGELGKLTN